MLPADELDPLPSLTPGAARVLDAASDLFYREGIHAVGVDTIAAAAGVTKKTLYDRFGSKDALVIHYLRARDARWRDYLRRGLDATPDGSADRILAVFDISARWADEQNRNRGCSAINARAEIEDPRHPIAAEAIRQKVWLRDVIAELCRDADIDDPEGTADALMLLYEGGLVTTGMGTFAEPFAVGRAAAMRILGVTA